MLASEPQIPATLLSLPQIRFQQSLAENWDEAHNATRVGRFVFLVQHHQNTLGILLDSLQPRDERGDSFFQLFSFLIKNISKEKLRQANLKESSLG